MVEKLDVFKYSLRYKNFRYLQDKCMEEMTELMKAIFKAREQGFNYSDDIEQEFADAQLMLDQLRYCYDDSTEGEFSENVARYEKAKCNKLWDIWHDENLVERNGKC